MSDSDSTHSHHREKRKGKSKSWKSKLKKSSKKSIKKRRKQSSSAEDNDSDSSEASTGSNRPRSKLKKKQLKRLNQSGQQRSKSSGSFLGSEQIPSKASALIVTFIVKVQSTSCQMPILFSTTDSWHEFDEKISKDVLDDKYSSYSISYVCEGVDVLLTKSTWNIFLHFIKTQCPDQMVFINVTGSPSLLTDKLCGYNFLSSTTSKTAKSSSASGSSSGVAPKEDVTSKTQEEGERNEKLSTMPRSEARESSMRKIVAEFLKESKCEKCNTKHKHILSDHAIEVDLSLEKKLRPACSTTEMRIFLDKRNGFSMFLAMLPYY